MAGKVWKRISGKLPSGKKAAKIGLGVSAAVWIGAGAAFFILKDKQLHGDEEGHGTGVAAVTSAHGGHGPVSGRGDGHGHAAAGEAAAHGHASGAAAGHGDGHDAHAAPADHHATADAGHGSHGGGSPHGAAEAHGNGHAAGHDAPDAKAHGDSHAKAHGDGHAKADGHGHGDARQGDSEEAEARIIPSDEEIAAQRQVAELLAADGELAKAVAPMRRVMLSPTREKALLSLAVKVFLGTANYPEALGFAAQLAGIAPDDMENQVRLVEAQYRLGQVDKAFHAAQDALKRHPGNLAMLTQLASMEVDMGAAHPDYGKSLAAALKIDPGHVPALYLQGRKSQLEGDYQDAEAAFAKVVRQEPGNAKALGQLGMAQYHLGRLKEAERSFKAELAINPADYNTWYNLGELHLMHANGETQSGIVQARRVDAMECYLKALELNPDHAQAHYRVGVLLNGNQQYKEAIRHLEAALKRDSRHVPTLVQLSLAYENLKQLEQARTYLNKAFELDPLNKVVLFKLRRLS